MKVGNFCLSVTLTSAIFRMLGRTNGAITFDLHSSVSGGNTLDIEKEGIANVCEWLLESFCSRSFSLRHYPATRISLTRCSTTRLGSNGKTRGSPLKNWALDTSSFSKSALT